MKSCLKAEAEHHNLRMDVFLARCGEISRSAAARLLENGQVCLNGKAVRKSHTVSAGEIFTVTWPEAVPMEAEAEDIPLDVVYEDGDLIVVNKSRGMVVHPAPGHRDGTLVSALLHHCRGSLSGIGGVLRPGIVHRLDKDTSGLLVAAKNDFTHAALSRALKERRISRVYEALALGHFREARFTVDAPLGRHPAHRKKMAVVSGGRHAVTHVTTLAQYPNFSHVRCKLETGRTHQIRVHLAYTGHPLLGDTLYGAGPNRFGVTGQALHARFLTFTHPRTGAEIACVSELPDYFQEILRKLDAGG